MIENFCVKNTYIGRENDRLKIELESLKKSSSSRKHRNYRDVLAEVSSDRVEDFGKNAAKLEQDIERLQKRTKPRHVTLKQYDADDSD
jgi:hypothetical protein